MNKKNISIFAILLLFALAACKDNPSAKITDVDIAKAKEISEASSRSAVLQFDKVEHDFGVINEGDKVTTEFIVKNTGNADLVIVNATGSCGCTVPVYKKEPIKPGESTPIQVTFDSTGKPGQQEKTVTLTTNTASGKEICTIKANVTPKNPNVNTPSRRSKH